jgi:putative membrane protein
MKRLVMTGVSVVVSSAAAYAHGPGEGPGGGMMGPGMMGWGYGMGWFWPILMLVFWIAVIVGIVFLIRWVSTRTREHGGFGESAIEILKKRYARGEITKEEFEKMKKDIGE